jgi:hypothetical protein
MANFTAHTRPRTLLLRADILAQPPSAIWRRHRDAACGEIEAKLSALEYSDRLGRPERVAADLRATMIDT